ncbi:hypothetical protein AB1A81_10570 [Bdellovibrio bacteriovorus]|uniref:Uncharacterized protein n=1 Tax=Bdellovibrio bacteriovorus (strain ATCC 15356 / DSM 50701 / NCIMB 9529 / HD100) TaxID=264462 RepID=Q6MKS7_BDEBA|nr:hypothetical protein [Bdellovibrio bacteriovorus]CAE80130.1 hypothetical protein predicted by Glimmer/Critica [Bdellovibrio bacteriovorus HD100]
MKDYIQYLQDVLGLQNVMLAPEQAGAEAAKTQFFTAKGPFTVSELRHYELVFLNILTQSKESLFLPEVNDLYSKMKAAMKLRNLQVLELDCTVEDRSQLPSELAKICESKVVVVYSSFPKDIGELIFKGPGKWLETYSPAYLLEDPAAKKVVWNDLQKVMKELGV